MLTIIMECHNDEAELAQTLSALVAGAVEGVVRDVIVLDHGSTDGSARVADAAGCRFLTDWDLKDVVQSARGDWLLLLEPGARPLAGWVDAVIDHVAIDLKPARFAASATIAGASSSGSAAGRCSNGATSSASARRRRACARAWHWRTSPTAGRCASSSPRSCLPGR